jgi:hypothetical protein
MLHHDRHEMLFFLKFQEHTVNGKRCVTQLEVWRERAALATKDVTSEVFWNYLLSEHDAIISDEDHTEAGKAFWELRVAEAFSKGLNVSFLNMSSKQALPAHDENHFRDNLRKFYGEEGRFQLWRLVISKEPFPSK